MIDYRFTRNRVERYLAKRQTYVIDQTLRHCVILLKYPLSAENDTSSQTLFGPYEIVQLWDTADETESDLVTHEVVHAKCQHQMALVCTRDNPRHFETTLTLIGYVAYDFISL